WKWQLCEASRRSRQSRRAHDGAPQRPPGDGRRRRVRSARLAGAQFGRDGDGALARPERCRRQTSFERGNSQQNGCKNLTNGSAMKQKVYPSLDAAVADDTDGARIMFGGFGVAGLPNYLIQALARQGTQNITVVHSTSAGATTER